jgi:hypothetical protein
MKKILFNLMVLIPLIYIVSCSKNEEPEINSQDGVRMYLSVDPTEALIMNFIQKMDLVRENPEYEGSKDWNFTKDSAVWYLEAALNLSHSHILVISEQQWNDSTTSSIEDNGSGFFNIVQIQTAYDAIIEDLDEQFEAIEADHKCLQYVNIETVDYLNNFLGLKTYINWGKGLEALPDGEWYIDGDEGMLAGQYNHGNAMTKLRQMARNQFGSFFEEVDYYAINVVIDYNSGSKHAYTGYYYPTFLPNYWFYAQKATSPYYLFSNTLSDSQISFYKGNNTTLTALRQNQFSSLTAFDWDFYMNFLLDQYDPTIGFYRKRWYQVNTTLGTIKPRTGNPNTYIQ